MDRRFEELVRAEARPVSTYARSVASTPTIAEDAVQETFLRAWRYLDSFRGDGSRQGWLIRICRNVIHDLEAAERRSVPEGDWTVVHLDRASGPIEVVDGDRVDDLAGLQLSDLVNRLPLPHREVVVLCGLLGYSYDEAAKVLDLPVGTVRSRLSRARAALRDELAATGSPAPASDADPDQAVA